MKVKINTHGNALPEVHGEWIDLCTAEDVTLDFLEYKIISLGVSIEIPAGYYAHVVPRSSTFGKWGILLANSMGVIENDYASNPMWYQGGDNKNGESKLAKQSFFHPDGTFKIAEYMHFCNRLLKKEPKEKGQAPAMIVFCAFEQMQTVIEYGKRYGFAKSYPLFFCKNYSAQVLKANMKIVGATEFAVVLYRDKLPKFRNVGEDGGKHMVFDWFRWERDSRKEYPKIHPTQKPVGVLKRLIEVFTDPGDVVIDPVAGSGTTLRAAYELGRSAYGFEVDKSFYEAAREIVDDQRLKEHSAHWEAGAKQKQGYKKVKTKDDQARASAGDSIEQRPPEVESREEFGHWEGDTVYSGKGKCKTTSALLTLNERKTRKDIIIGIPNRKAETVVKALDALERKCGAKRFRVIFKSITFDNGSEFSAAEELERSAVNKTIPRTKVYFCHPYSSWERGSNENANSMIRRRHPKGTDFSKVSAAEIAATEEWINNYPRKIFGYKSSEVMFRECLREIGLIA